MIKGKKIASNKNRNETANRRAMSNTKVQILIGNLRRDWEAVDPPERGRRLRELAAFGCSIRGLQMEVPASPTSIRRLMKLSELPGKNRNAQTTRVAAKEVPEQKAGAECDRGQRRRIVEGQKTGAPGNEVALINPEFRPAEKRPQETPISKEEVALSLTTKKVPIDIWGDNQLLLAKNPDSHFGSHNVAAIFFTHQGKPALPRDSASPFPKVL